MHDMQKYPPKTTTQRGHIRYHGSEIERLLKKDVAEGKSKGKSPSDLHNSRPEYKAMPLEVFRKHKAREDQYLVESVGWQKIRNEKGRKKHEKKEEERENPMENPIDQITDTKQPAVPVSI